MPTITIHNVTSPKYAEPLVRALQGKTYMNLEVGLAPVGGSLDVLVTTTRPETSEEELRGMVMSVLCGLACDMGGPEMQRAVAEGCDRLNDGDENDRQNLARVERKMLMNYGMLRSNSYFYPAEEATNGYLREENGSARYVWIDGSGKWTAGDHAAVPEGATLYASEDCDFPIRKVS